MRRAARGHSSTVVGGVKDPGVKALLAMLADHNPGLCIVTTRIQLAELRGADGVERQPLDRLPQMAGIELLRDLGVEPRYPPASSLRAKRSNPEATLSRCGDPEATNEPLREAETIAERGPMPLFMAQAHLLRARIALSQGNLTTAKAKREAALKLIAKHGYGRAAPDLALLTAEIACAENSANREATIATAIAAIRGKPHHDERTGVTIDGGWWGLLPRLELLLAADDPRLAELRAARDAYNAERDAYLRSTLANDVEGYHPADDPIAAYLGVHVWAEEDRALADPDFRRQLSELLVANGYQAFDELPLSEQRNATRQIAPKMRKAQHQEEAPAPDEIPDALVQHIFADPSLQELLREVMRQNNLAGEPADLSIDMQRSIVAALVKAGAINLGETPPPEAPPPPAEKKKRGWWPFG